VSAKSVSPSPLSANHTTPVTAATLSEPYSSTSTDALLKKIIDHLNSGTSDGLPLDMPEPVFEEIQRRLQNFPGRLRFNYDYINQKMIIYGNPSPIHESAQTFFSRVNNAMNDNLQSIDSRLRLDQWGSQGTILQKEGRKSHNKAADVSFVTRIDGKDDADRYPHFVVEIGYSEKEEQLLRDAKGWLCESLGIVLAVLIIKFERPKDQTHFRDISKWNGWIQVYVQRYVYAIPTVQ
jgi:Uma2 family endonuclease